MAKFLLQFTILLFLLLAIVNNANGSLATVVRKMLNAKQLAGAKPKIGLKPTAIGGAKPVPQANLQAKPVFKANIGEQRMESLPKIYKIIGEMPG
uniref:Hypothetical salivary secreted protein n=1 Tax=Simulium nigrimanum TaxID=683695 RepID=D1FPT8_SIMNI